VGILQAVGSYAWPWLILMFLQRILELGCVANMLLLVSKKKPAEESNSGKSTEMASIDTQVDSANSEVEVEYSPEEAKRWSE